MFYSHKPAYPNIQHPQPKLRLPSFNELLTSISLSNDFIQYNNQQSPSFLAVPQPHNSNYLSISPAISSTSPSLITDTSVSTTGTLSSISTPGKISPAENKLPTPPLSISTSSNINKSIRSSPRDMKRKHICKVCSRSFTTSGHLARHNRIHTGERKHQCPWPTCEARFARQDNCMQHYKTHTNGKNKRSKLNFKSTK